MTSISITWNTVVSGLEKLLQDKLVFMIKVDKLQKEINVLLLEMILSKIKNWRLLNIKHFCIFKFL